MEVTWARMGHVGASWSRGLLWEEAGGGKSTSLADSAVGVGEGMGWNEIFRCLFGGCGQGLSHVTSGWVTWPTVKSHD